MKWLHAYRNGTYVQILFVAATLEAIKARQYGRWFLRRRSTSAL